MNNSTFVRVLRKVERVFVIILFLGIVASVFINFINFNGLFIIGYILGLFTVFLWYWYKNIGRGDIEISGE